MHFSSYDIEKLMPTAAVNTCIRQVYRAQAAEGTPSEIYRYDTPLRAVHRLAASPGQKKFLGIMPSSRIGSERGDTQYMGVKCLSVFLGRSDERSSHQGIYTLFDGNDGRLLCTLDAGSLTAQRTAASSAVAAQALWPMMGRTGQPLRVGLVGTGEQARRHAAALVEAFAASSTPVAEISLWGRHTARARTCAQAIEAELGSRVRCLTSVSVEALAPQVDLLCTLTASSAPVVGAEAIFGQPRDTPLLIVAVGACTAQSRELSCEVVAGACQPLVVDTREGALCEAGDLLASDVTACLARRGQKLDDIVMPLSSVLREGYPTSPRPSVVVFKSVGFGALDLALAVATLERAQRGPGA